LNIVSDTSIFLAVALDEPEKKRIIDLTSGVDVIAPEILPYEIGNALSALRKRDRIMIDEALSAQNTAGRISVRAPWEILGGARYRIVIYQERAIPYGYA